MDERRTTPDLPRALERALAEAARDPAFAEELLRERGAALERRGHALSATEAALLRSVPEAQLRQMLETLAGRDALAPEEPILGEDVVRGTRPGGYEPAPIRGIRPGRLLLGAAAATVVLGGAASTLLCVTGSRPDVPPATQSVQGSGPETDAGGPRAAPSSPDEDGGSQHE